MPGKDRVIDPITKDYVDDGVGGCLETETQETAVYHQLTGHLGRWPGDAKAGALLFTLQRENDTDETEHRAVDYTTSALQPLVDVGRILNVQVETDRNERGELVVTSSEDDAVFGPLPPLPLSPGGI